MPRTKTSCALNMYDEDKVWSRYSNDKVNIGEELAFVIRRLNKALPLSTPMRALSIGSSAEPQFRILETAFRGGLYLMDIEKEALKVVTERIKRQWTDHVTTIPADYTRILLDPAKTERFLETKLDTAGMNLVTMHHSLYYCSENDWPALFRNIWVNVLAPKSAIHAVLMCAESDDPCTTTWLYNHFAGKFFNHTNNQCLRKLKNMLENEPVFKNAKITFKTNKVRFFADDFEKFMAVVWMILLYPNVHRYTPAARKEISEFVRDSFWKNKKPMIQSQDHLVISRGLD